MDLMKRLIHPLLWLVLCSAIASADDMKGFTPIPQGKETDKGRHFATEAMRRFNERYKATLSKAARPEAADGEETVAGKIVGGEDSLPGAYPWMAALVRPGVTDNLQAQFCGASLVHPYWVVTAAHCIDDIGPGGVQVLLGAHNLDTGTTARRYEVVEIIIHPEFRSTTLDADLALLRLAEPAAPEYLPLRLIDDDDLAAPGVVARILGWGALVEDGDYPEILQEAEVPVVSLAVANATAAYDGELTGNMLPAGYSAGGVDSCQGDSGGPLVVVDPVDNMWLLAGITSYGSGCGNPNAYGIYTRLVNFRPYVVSHLWPSYAEWEQETGARGETRDPDGDGRNHFGDFVFGPGAAMPPQPGFLTDGGGTWPTLDFRARGFDGVADFGFEHADSPGGPWTQVPFDDALVASTAVPDVAGAFDLKLAVPISPYPARRFMRASASPSGEIVPAVRVFDTTRWVNGALAVGDAVHPDQPAKFTRTYRLDNLAVGVAVEITGRSHAFDVRLELLDGPGGTLLATADSDGALGVLGTDERLSFTPLADVDYHVRVSPKADGGKGSFHLGCLRPSAYNALTQLSVPQSNTAGSLLVSDPIDPLWQPLVFYSDNYRLAATSSRARLNLTSSAFDTYLELVDAETGRLIMKDDDSGSDLNARINYKPVPGVSYIVRATSAVAESTGSYTISSTVEALPTIGVPTNNSGSLTTGDELDPKYPLNYKDDYKLINLTPGQVVTVNMNTFNFDAYLFLLDGVDETLVIAEDDSSGVGGVDNARITFTVQAGRSYTIRASSYFEDETGSYQLTTQ
jgi:hypothetical protein